jgi:hypothetical protein
VKFRRLVDRTWLVHYDNRLSGEEAIEACGPTRPDEEVPGQQADPEGDQLMTPPLHLGGAPAPPIDSPALNRDAWGAAYELKFRLSEVQAGAVEAWARERMAPDPYGEAGTYRITSVYCDTPGLAVYHRAPGFKRSKYRLRRYGTSPAVWLERKKKQGGRVRKKRTGVPLEELARLAAEAGSLDWAGGWFLQRIRFRELRPVCRVGYDRTAFVGQSPDGPLRLTLDRHLVGVPTRAWEVPPLEEGQPLLPGAVVLELKFHAGLPGLFHELLARLPARPEGASKYRLCVESWAPLPREAP